VGKTNRKKQIAGVKSSFILVDSLEIGFVEKIPVWLMGFLY
jgi:hypothetical protein